MEELNLPEPAYDREELVSEFKREIEVKTRHQAYMAGREAQKKVYLGTKTWKYGNHDLISKLNEVVNQLMKFSKEELLAIKEDFNEILDEQISQTEDSNNTDLETLLKIEQNYKTDLPDVLVDKHSIKLTDYKRVEEIDFDWILTYQDAFGSFNCKKCIEEMVVYSIPEPIFGIKFCKHYLIDAFNYLELRKVDLIQLYMVFSKKVVHGKNDNTDDIFMKIIDNLESFKVKYNSGRIILESDLTFEYNQTLSGILNIATLNILSQYLLMFTLKDVNETYTINSYHYDKTLETEEKMKMLCYLAAKKDVNCVFYQLPIEILKYIFNQNIVMRTVSTINYRLDMPLTDMLSLARRCTRKTRKLPNKLLALKECKSYYDHDYEYTIRFENLENDAVKSLINTPCYYVLVFQFWSIMINLDITIKNNKISVKDLEHTCKRISNKVLGYKCYNPKKKTHETDDYVLLKIIRVRTSLDQFSKKFIQRSMFEKKQNKKTNKKSKSKNLKSFRNRKL